VKALSAAMIRVLSDPELRTRIAAKASEVNQRFSLQTVLAAWQRVLEGTVRDAHRQ
jgi:glycosyltransferase involved in cell wall biosynthesis